MNRWCMVVVGVGLAIWVAASDAEIPQVISYQGKVTDTSGNPVADGSYTMRFRIYDAVTAGTLLWDSGARTVAVAGGVFSVLLGESPQPALNLGFDEDYWLMVTFSGVDQTPRQRMASSGYAYMASGLVPGTVVSGSVEEGAVITGTNTSNGGYAFGLRGESYSTTDGRGVIGVAAATVGQTCGVDGRSASTAGRGVYGWAFSETGPTYGGYFESASTHGRGVYGRTTATSGETYGGHFESLSTGGYGVRGYALATAGFTYGVMGSSSSTAGTGVYGWAAATSGTAYGGRFESLSAAGRGVAGCAWADSGTTYGMHGESFSIGGTGVYGWTHATTGITHGVDGRSESTAGRGVRGVASATSGSTYGGYFESASMEGLGVAGFAEATAGITYGVYGQSASTEGRAVFGLATATTGTNFGVWGETASSGGYGVLGLATAPDAIAVSGVAAAAVGTAFRGRFEVSSLNGTGVFGWAIPSTGWNKGVYGKSISPSGWGVYYSGGLGGTGLMRAIVRTSQGPTGLDAVTAAGSWVEDFGEGQLVDGRCHIELDPLFLETVTIDEANPMQVSLQPYHRSCAGLVVERGVTGFDVCNPLDASASGGFGYRVVAKRKGFETKRLDVCEAARTDSYLYPELREKELREREEMGARREEERARMEAEHARMKADETRPSEKRSARLAP